MDMYLPDSIPAEAYTPAEACTQHQKEKGPSILVSIDIKSLETHSNGFKLSHTFISESVAMAREMERSGWLILAVVVWISLLVFPGGKMLTVTERGQPRTTQSPSTLSLSSSSSFSSWRWRCEAIYLEHHFHSSLHLPSPLCVFKGHLKPLPLLSARSPFGAIYSQCSTTSPFPFLWESFRRPLFPCFAFVYASCSLCFTPVLLAPIFYWPLLP